MRRERRLQVDEGATTAAERQALAEQRQGERCRVTTILTVLGKSDLYSRWEERIQQEGKDGEEREWKSRWTVGGSQVAGESPDSLQSAFRSLGRGRLPSQRLTGR